MGNITYEQFVLWCKHWDMTIDEGFRAMCFTANIIGQNFANCIEYTNKVSNDTNHSDAFKSLVEKLKNDALILSTLYSSLNTSVFKMLEENDTKSESKE